VVEKKIEEGTRALRKTRNTQILSVGRKFRRGIPKRKLASRKGREATGRKRVEEDPTGAKMLTVGTRRSLRRNKEFSRLDEALGNRRSTGKRRAKTSRKTIFSFLQIKELKKLVV